MTPRTRTFAAFSFAFALICVAALAAKSSIVALRARTEQGYADAQFNLGWMYAKGDGVPMDSTEAVKCYQKAAEQELAHAQYNLGVMYANGTGVTKDPPEAVEWFRNAAVQGMRQLLRPQSDLRHLMVKLFGLRNPMGSIRTFLCRRSPRKVRQLMVTAADNFWSP